MAEGWSHVSFRCDPLSSSLSVSDSLSSSREVLAHVSLFAEITTLVTYKLYPRGMFRRPVRGLILSQLVTSNRLEAACPLIESLATAL
jgi:hypothetical protein